MNQRSVSSLKSIQILKVSLICHLNQFRVRFGHFGQMLKVGEELGYEGVSPWRYL